MIELPFSISYCLPQVFIPRDTEVVLFKLIEKQTRFVMLIEKRANYESSVSLITFLM